MSDLKPWHDTVACPHCKVRVVARVWWSAGAQAGREESERERGARL